MPLPHPPGYRSPSQARIDHRRVLFSGVLFAGIMTLLLVLGRRAAEMPGSALPPPSHSRFLVVILAAGGCGAWGELMRQLSRVARHRDRSAP